MNFLIFISDEHRRDAMGCAGHPIVKTPNLDALAARGTRFSNAYTPSPMCVPTRAAIATGRHVHQTRHWDSATPYAGDPKSWMALLRDNNIPATSIGKLHYRSGADDNGWAEEILPMHVVGGVGWVAGLLRDEQPDYDSAKELAADAGAGESSYTEYDRAITDAAVDWVQNQDKDQPWACFVSMVAPHYPLTAPEEFYNLYNPDHMDFPLGYGMHAPDHPELQHLRSFFKYDDYFDEPTMKRARAAYYGLCSFLDDNIGKVIKALEASGELENTCILYVSDHGEMLGDYGMWTKQTMYETSVGVPMIMAGPDIPQGKICRTGASLYDIAPTALSQFSVPIPAEMVGTDLTQLSQSTDKDRVIFAEYHDGGSSTAAFMVRWDKWKYVHYVGKPPQLFNLISDPNEFNDLGLSNMHGDIRAEGERLLREICDPDAVNDQAFADQRAKVVELGGKEKCRTGYIFNHTPTPNEQAEMAKDLFKAREGSAL